MKLAKQFALIPLLLWAGQAQVLAQATNGKLVAKDGREVPWSEVTMNGTAISWTTKNPSTGGPMLVTLTAADIIRMDFPEPPQLQEALLALNRNEVDKAVSLAQPLVQQFAPFKTTAGTWYPAASVIQLEALALKKDPSYEKQLSELKAINLSITDQARLATVEATYDYVKGIFGLALASVEKILPTVEDGAVKAKLHLLKGDIQYKRGNFTESLEAYLHVPVFYGAQAAYLPNAELGAARALQKMGRLEDAAEALRSFKERYKGLPQVAEADKELAALSQALGAATAPLTAPPEAAPEKEPMKK